MQTAGRAARRGTRRLLTILVILLLLPACAVAEELKLATWNLEWLTGSDRDLPPDVRPAGGYRPLRRYAANWMPT
jgi:hypothetical protein